MVFYMLLYPIAFALTFAIVNSDIDIIYKEMLAMIPPLAVTAGMVGEFRESKRGVDDDE